jgi:hypothetical protein
MFEKKIVTICGSHSSMDVPSPSSSSHYNSNDSLPTTEHTATLFIHPSNNRNAKRRKIKTTSNHTSPNDKWFPRKRRVVRVSVRRKTTDVASIGFPLGMSFAAVMAQVRFSFLLFWFFNFIDFEAYLICLCVFC